MTLICSLATGNSHRQESASASVSSQLQHARIISGSKTPHDSQRDIRPVATMKNRQALVLCSTSVDVLCDLSSELIGSSTLW